MHPAIGTAMLESLILNEQLTISELTRQVGVSYPTTLSRLQDYQFIHRRKNGRDTLLSIDRPTLDVVFPFVTIVQTSPTKLVLLALAYARRKGLGKFLLGGELAVQMQLYTKNADPYPQIEIRAKHPKVFKKMFAKFLQRAPIRELPSVSVVPDKHVRPELSTRIGVIMVSRPEKVAVDAIAESDSEVYIDSVIQAILASPKKVDFELLKQYAKQRGVLHETSEQIVKFGVLNFP